MSALKEHLIAALTNLDAHPETVQASRADRGLHELASVESYLYEALLLPGMPFLILAFLILC